MNLIINGVTQVSLAETLTALIEQLGMKSDRVAIELNREIISREQWPQTALHEGDRLEIVQFVGGGSNESGRICAPCCGLASCFPTANLTFTAPSFNG